MLTTLDEQYNLIKTWGIVNSVEHLNPSSQRISIDSALGNGFFERYDFTNTRLSRLQCQFHETQHLTNYKCKTDYAIHFTLQGSSQIKLNANPRHNEPKQFTLTAPTVWLVKGDLGSYSTTIHTQQLIKAFYIELEYDFIKKLTQQLQHRNDFHHSVLTGLISTEGHLSIPLALNNHTLKLIQKAWQLFKTASPTDELSFMALQGETLTFTSDILKQSLFSLTAITDENYPIEKCSSQVYQAKILLDENYHQNWTIREIAKKVGTNECYLKSQFKQLTQKTIVEYRTQKRMEVALKQLKQGVPIACTAKQTGFNSTDYFSKVFIKFYGYPPTEVLNELEKQLSKKLFKIK